MKIAIIDNYDSFTYNLAHLVRELGAEVNVLRNDQFRLEELEAYDKLLLSPGPGIPQEAGLLPEVIRMYAGRKPMLGVCLGHQAIGEAFGARLENLKEVYHGVQTPVSLLAEEAGGEYIFRGLPCRILAGRYHSWIVPADSIPPFLQVTAMADGQVMALRHRVNDIHGIQFHPESVLTPDGKAIVSNWMNGAEN